MKAIILQAILYSIVVLSLNSCRAEVEDLPIPLENPTQNTETFQHSPSEIETMAKINAYRVNIGLNELKEIDHISFKAKEHNIYMIDKNIISHDNFESRSDNIIKVLSAKVVAENLAYNYNTSQAVFDAWLKSAPHKENIEGNYTHFGIAITENTQGKKYFTNIFVKL